MAIWGANPQRTATGLMFGDAGQAVPGQGLLSFPGSQPPQFTGAMGTFGNQQAAPPQGGGGMTFFPQQQKVDWRGQADFLRAMKEGQPQNFAALPSFNEGIQGALSQMGGLLSNNANTVTRRAEMEAMLGLQSQLGNRQLDNQLMLGGAMFGMQPEQYITGQERVQAPDRIRSIVGQGNVSVPGGYTYQNTYGTRMVPGQGPGQGSQRQPQPQPSGYGQYGGDPAGVQDQAAQSLYGQTVAGAAPAAFAQGGGLAGATFGDPGGQFGSASLPTPPWAGGQPGSADMGIDTTGGQVWNPQLAEQANQRLGQVGQTVAPYMSGDPSAQSGMQQQFGDYLLGAQGRAMNQLQRGGQQAEAQQQLESQVTGSRLQNALWQLMSKLYGSNLGSAGDQNALALRMQQYLA